LIENVCVGTSKSIPSQQRRGAILALGMFAIAKPEIISSRMDEVLRIGLGPHGKVGFIVLRFE
jgi:condensin complex subunit 1